MHNNIYIPEKATEKMQLNEEEEIYDYFSTIRLEWPAQSLKAYDENTIVCGMNGRENSLLFISLRDEENVTFRKIQSDSINRLIINKFIFAVSDTSLMKFDETSCLKKIEGNFDYGLFSSENKIFAAQAGTVYIYDFDFNLLMSVKLHGAEINCIYEKNGILFTGSNDGFLRIYDWKNKSLVFEFDFKNDINTLAVKNNLLLLGLDDSSICLFDWKNLQVIEYIHWHKNPINHIQFVDETSFISTSDEQVALFDIDLDGKWEFHKYLYFVHQGEEQYREADILPNSEYMGEPIYLITSQNGITLFRKMGVEE